MQISNHIFEKISDCRVVLSYIHFQSLVFSNRNLHVDSHQSGFVFAWTPRFFFAATPRSSSGFFVASELCEFLIICAL